MSARIEIVNWGRFQHYKQRSPPWIKLHRALLDNREWYALSGDASKLLAECWLVASEYGDGVIPMDARDLAWRLRRENPIRVGMLLQELAGHGFVRLGEQWDSGVLAECEQHATPEAEAEESVKDAKASLSGSLEPDRAKRKERDELTARKVLQVFEYWRTRCGHERATLTADRKAKIKARLKGYSVEDLCRAIDAAAESPFYQGDNDRQTRYDFPETIFKTDAAMERLMLAPVVNRNNLPVVVND